ncbi:MAG: hypothetical protein BWY74_02191 [Firmicutes bacterium ADurb.Bin419]|nr:MAG: hypothetical protein BWY74_02191 [Firmicutes bacterium ADurb.Bin419]
MSQRKKNAYRYFIYNIQEYLKLEHCNLEIRKMDSFRALLLDFLELQEEINNSTGDKNKYQKSQNNLIEAIVFYCEENPIAKHPSLQKDLKCLKELLQQQEKSDVICVYNTVNSIYKKMNLINVLDVCIDVIQEYVDDYFDVDKLTETYISELLFEGYSLKYLEEWWGHAFKSEIMKEVSDYEGLRGILNRFRELSSKKSNDYEIILKVSLPNKIREELKEKKSLKINNVEYKSFDIGMFEKKGDFDKFFESSKFENLIVKINSCDVYKSIELVRLPLENYIEMFKIIDTSVKEKIINGCLVKENNMWREIPLHNEASYLKKMTVREKEDVQDFIELRDILRQKGMISFDISIIERVINLLQKMPELTRENRLLNTWASLEYILKFYNKDSIIEKVRQIVPRVICLYFFKNKMNILWDKILPSMSYLEESEISGLKECMSKESSKKYNREAFALFLKNTDSATKLHDFFNANIVIQRKICELNCFLNKPEDLMRILKYTSDSVKHDLNSIYRLRNKLVHAGGGLRTDVELYSIKLQKYVNCIIGTIIYHIKRSPESLISEILYSIIQTYDNYYDLLKGIVCEKDGDKVNQIISINIRQIAFPPYLYL